MVFGGEEEEVEGLKKSKRSSISSLLPPFFRFDFFQLRRIKLFGAMVLKYVSFLEYARPWSLSRAAREREATRNGRRATARASKRGLLWTIGRERRRLLSPSALSLLHPSRVASSLVLSSLRVRHLETRRSRLERRRRNAFSRKRLPAETSERQNVVPRLSDDQPPIEVAVVLFRLPLVLPRAAMLSSLLSLSDSKVLPSVATTRCVGADRAQPRPRMPRFPPCSLRLRATPPPPPLLSIAFLLTFFLSLPLFYALNRPTGRKPASSRA